MKYKTGDCVRVARNTPEWENWTEGMSKFLGQTFEVQAGGNHVDYGPQYKLQNTPYYFREDALELVTLTPAWAEEPKRNKYMREIKPGVWVDVYDVLRAFKVTDQALGHLLKKALAVGQRGHKDATQDYKDILDSAKRANEIHLEFKGD